LTDDEIKAKLKMLDGNFNAMVKEDRRLKHQHAQEDLNIQEN